MDADLEKLSIEELKKIDADNEELDAKIRAEIEENVGILDEKIKESRKETDEALKAAKETLLQSIADRRERIAELKSQNNSLNEKAQQINGETMSFLTDIVEKLKVNSITDVPVQIEKLKSLEKESKSLQNQIQIYQTGGEISTRNIQLISKIEEVLRIWDAENLKLPQDSPLNGLFDILREWLRSMKQENFEKSNTVSNDFVNEIDSLMNV